MQVRKRSTDERQQEIDQEHTHDDDEDGSNDGADRLLDRDRVHDVVEQPEDQADHDQVDHERYEGFDRHARSDAGGQRKVTNNLPATQVPLLIISDDPSQSTGLARITRDLATVLSSSPRWRVATLGLGGVGSRSLPWQCYHMARYPNGGYEYGELSLPQVWDDWSRGQPGVVFTIQDLSRMLWLAQPSYVADDALRSWLEEARSTKFQLWGYIPQDHTGPHDRLSVQATSTAIGYNRLLMYTPWAEDIMRRTIGEEAAAMRDLFWLPHGLNLRTFAPLDHTGKAFDVGIVMTNQARKDWGLAAQVCAGLARHNLKFKAWWHVDTLHRAWNIEALLADHELVDCVDVTQGGLTDALLAERYNQCRITMLPSLGEGFGYPIFESLACGVPCLHGAYGGGASLLECFGLDHLLVPAIGHRLEGEQNAVRPVFDPGDWIAAAERRLATPDAPEHYRSKVEHLDWRALGQLWLNWFSEGLRRADRMAAQKAVTVQ